MKYRFFIILLSLLVVAACVSAPKKQKSRSAKSQHERARAAFDELDGKPSSASTTSKSTPKPAYSEPKREKPTPPPDTPDPVEPDEEPDFSSSKYLTAKGYGMSKPEAVRQAKAELSNIFEARISSDVSSKVRQVTDSMKGGSYNKSIQSKIRVVSNIELEGVQVGKTWKEHGEYVAIAALDKHRAREKWAGDIKEVDTKIQIQLNKSKKSKSKLLKLLPLKKVLDLWVEREVAVSRLRVLGFSSEFGSSDLQPILEQISSLKTTMLIDLDVAGEHGKTVRDKVAEILTDNDFKIGEYKSEADVLITGSVTIKKVKTNNPRFKYSRAIVSLNIIDSLSQNQVGQISENDRGAGLNYEESAHSAVKKVSKKVSKKLIKYFN